MHTRTALIRSIIIETCMEFGISTDELKTYSPRMQPFCDARNKIIYRLYTETWLTFVEISIYLPLKKASVHFAFKNYIKEHSIVKPKTGWKKLCQIPVLITDENEPYLPYLFD